MSKSSPLPVRMGKMGCFLLQTSLTLLLLALLPANAYGQIWTNNGRYDERVTNSGRLDFVTVYSFVQHSWFDGSLQSETRWYDGLSASFTLGIPSINVGSKQLIDLGSTCVPGWWIRGSLRAGVGVRFPFGGRCGQTGKIRRKWAIAPVKCHDEAATSSVTTTKSPPWCSHEPHKNHRHPRPWHTPRQHGILSCVHSPTPSIDRKCCICPCLRACQA